MEWKCRPTFSSHTSDRPLRVWRKELDLCVNILAVKPLLFAPTSCRVLFLAVCGHSWHAYRGSVGWGAIAVEYAYFISVVHHYFPPSILVIEISYQTQKGKGQYLLHIIKVSLFSVKHYLDYPFLKVLFSTMTVNVNSIENVSY